MTKKHREAIFARDKGICWLCGQPLGKDEPYDVDHVIPRELGGSDGDDNLRIAHKPCHREKSKGDVKAIAKSNRIRRSNGPVEDRRKAKPIPRPVNYTWAKRPFQKKGSDEMTIALWGWPQWVFVGLYSFNLITAAILDGQPKKDSRHSFGIALLATVVGFCILWAGGFFK